MRVEQFLPAFHYGDAIGNSALRFHRYLEKKGIESEIIALSVDESLRHLARKFSDYRGNSRSVKILHFAIPSPLTGFFKTAAGPKVMVYHNITPEKFFVPFSADMVRFTHAGRQELAELNQTFDRVIADSEYNARELQDLGYPDPCVFPIMIDLQQYNRPHSEAYFNLLKDDRKNIVFVGRISPNKCIEDLIKVVFYYKKYISPSIRLVIAGKTMSLPKYFYAVRDLASRFYLSSEDIFFTGHIPFEELLSVYRLGDVFLSMSEHEGFCLPLIESCHFRLPVVAYDAGAVADTLGHGGIVFREKKVEYAAGLVENVLSDRHLRNKLKTGAEKRIQAYEKQADPAGFFALLENL